jgi:hypothetical protein
MRDLLAPKTKNEDIPSVELRGRMLTAGQEPLAIISVGNKVYLIPEGSQVSLSSQPGSMAMRVAKVTVGYVQLEVLPASHNQTIFVH